MHATTGQAYPAVRPDDMAAYAIGLLELLEQMTIANALDHVDATITDAQFETDVLTYTRKSMSNVLLTGQARVVREAV